SDGLGGYRLLPYGSAVDRDAVEDDLDPSADAGMSEGDVPVMRASVIGATVLRLPELYGVRSVPALAAAPATAAARHQAAGIDDDHAALLKLERRASGARVGRSACAVDVSGID